MLLKLSQANYVGWLLVFFCWSRGVSSIAGESHSRAPNPPSEFITNILWQWDTRKTAAPGSDLWPVTWAADGNLYAAWGDGGGFGGTDTDGRVSMGFARIERGPEDFRGFNVNGGKNPEHPASFPKKGKTDGLLSVHGVIYSLVNLQDGKWPDVNHVLIWSTNLGATWTKADWLFPKGIGIFQPANFLNFGRDYSGVPKPLQGFVYICGGKQPRPGFEPTEAFLMRVSTKKIREWEAYEYFSGLTSTGKPIWSGKAAKMQPIFSDSNGVSHATVIWNPGLGRFLLTCYRSSANQLGVFEAPQPWGPWHTIAYDENWGDMAAPSEGLSCDFPQKWTSPDGLTLWCVFAVYGEGAKQGIKAHDSFNVVRAKLMPAK